MLPRFQVWEFKILFHFAVIFNWLGNTNAIEEENNFICFLDSSNFSPNLPRITKKRYSKSECYNGQADVSINLVSVYFGGN